MSATAQVPSFGCFKPTGYYALAVWSMDKKRSGAVKQGLARLAINLHWGETNELVSRYWERHPSRGIGILSL
jgi:hypothetical protein